VVVTDHKHRKCQKKVVDIHAYKILKFSVSHLCMFLFIEKGGGELSNEHSLQINGILLL